MAPGLSDGSLAAPPEPAAPGGPAVVLADEESASGMATMVAELLRDNVRDFRSRAAVAARLRGDVILSASDRDISITLSFRPGQVVVADGARDGAPELAGPWLEMASVCSGRTSPGRALAQRKLRVVPGRGMAVVPGAGFVLSVPARFYGEVPSRRPLIVAAVGVGAVAAVLVWRRRRTV